MERYVITKNDYNFKQENIFLIGKRANNPKRSFLFVSKLLGKHIEVNPEVVKATGFLLASLKYNFNNETFIDCLKKGTSPDYSNTAEDNPLVIGFCETATGLGMAVSSAIKGSFYQTTTREPILGVKKLLSFEEEHSHATTHNMFSYLTNLSMFKKIVLVDDEITTGNSLLNLMKSIKNNSSVEEFNIMTILDWRNESQKEAFNLFEKEYNVKVNTYSLIEGNINEEDKTLYPENKSNTISLNLDEICLNIFKRKNINTENGNQSYFVDSGRFGIKYDSFDNIEKYAKETAKEILKNISNETKNILVLGHGENIYIPSRIAAHIQKKNKYVKYRTTSLSPIYCDGTIIKDDNIFYDRTKKYHFYNKCDAEKYDIVILLTETPVNKHLCDNLIIYRI